MDELNICLKVITDESELILKNIKPKALRLSDWMDYECHRKTKIDLTGTVVGDSLDKNGLLIKDGQKVNFRSSMDSHMGHGCIALVMDGWLPAIYAIQRSQLLLDRNIVSEFSNRFELGNASGRNNLNPDFVDFLSHFDYECNINISAFAIEGSNRRHPNMEEVAEQLLMAKAKIQAALPGYKIQPAGPHAVNGILALIGEGRHEFERGVAFLQKVSPRLMQTLTGEKRRRVWDFILSAALECGLQKTDLIVFAAISAAAGSQKLNPAKKIIKPKPDYTEEDAYNAMADFQLLVLFMNLIQKFPNEKFVLLTKDKELAKLWMGIILIEASGENGIYQAKFEIDRSLLPLGFSDLDYLRESFGGSLMFREEPKSCP